MSYVIPPEPPEGFIDLEYDRLDYHLQRGNTQTLRGLCAALDPDKNVSTEKRAIARLFQGLQDINEGKVDSGLAALRCALDGPPYVRIRATSGLVLALISLGHLEAARTLLAPYLEAPPPSAELYLALGRYLAAAGDKEGEWQSYLKAQHLNPYYLPLMKQMIVCGMIPERFVELERVLAEYLAENPHNGAMRSFHAAALLALGHVEGAWNEVQRTVGFIELAPVDDEAVEVLRSLTIAIGNIRGGAAS